MTALDIFAGEADDFYTVYDVTVQIRDRLVGGIPASESTIRAWLAKKLEANDARLEELVQETLSQIDKPLSVDDKLDALMANPDVAAGNVFKRHPDGTGELMFEGRCIKAAFKEAANSVYPGTDWDGKRGDSGKTVGKGDKVKFAAKEGIPERKGLKAFLSESVMVMEDLIGTGAKELGADFYIEERVKHVVTPQGPRSAISRVEVIPSPTLSFTVKVRNDFLTRQAWAKIWQAMEELGFGSDRARSDGRFDLIRWEKVSPRLPAFASVRPPHPLTAPAVVVSIDDEHGTLTTASVLHVGEKLAAFGYITGTFTVTSLTPAGPVDRVTLSPAPNPSQKSEVLDFHPAAGS